MKRVKTVKNPCGLRVKKCCASCIHKCIDNDGLRACPIIDEYVEADHVCMQLAQHFFTLNPQGFFTVFTLFIFLLII